VLVVKRNQEDQEKKCPFCGGNLKPMPEFTIKLPTPSHEIVFGGISPQYSTKVELPFNCCEDCDVVFKKPEEKK